VNIDMITTAVYIVAALMFILSLAGLSKHETSRSGLTFGIAGMVLALGATIASLVLHTAGSAQSMVGLTLLVSVILVGAGIGLWRARVVAMTGMPELIALLHSFVGLAARGHWRHHPRVPDPGARRVA
jgi:NAD(P) transhydrogenase subunit beta